MDKKVVEPIQSSYLTPINRTTVSEEIVRRLISFILEQRLKPGDKLPSERELMALLSVGRSSLREAVKTLSAVGLIRIAAREGLYVGGGESSVLVLSRPLSWALLLHEQSTREVIEARRAVEVELAGLAAQRATNQALESIRLHLLALQAAANDGNTYMQCDIAFHLAVAQAADNRVLYHVLETLRNIMYAWIEKAIRANQGHPQSYEEHVPIVEAIRARDVTGARDAMAAHLDAAAARLLRVVAGDENIAHESGGSPPMVS